MNYIDGHLFWTVVFAIWAAQIIPWLVALLLKPIVWFFRNPPKNSRHISARDTERQYERSMHND